MARPQHKQEEPERGRRAAPKRGMSPLIPLVVVIVILGGGVMAVVAGSGKQPEQAPQPAASKKPKPFDDLPPELPPSKKAGSSGNGRSFIADAPDGLEKDANWQKAILIANEGAKLYDEAVAAKTAGDTALLNHKGAAARTKLNDAFDMTAMWEEELFTKYGDANPEVRRIVKTRSDWMDKVRWLHKSIAR
ncbi:MAG: hypothetical protein FJ298_02480 [Planctomycetes bacterium]|nr:hypothetical protein [Planctomycetota bacterium]